MAFARPTLSELIERTTSDMSTRVLGVEGAVLRRSLLGVIARGTAGAIHSLYGYLDWIARNSLPDTADSEILDRWAAIWGLTRNAATYATGTATFAGTSGTTIPAGTVVQRADGVQYTSTADATITAGTATVALEANEPGTAGNLEAGSALFLLQPQVGVGTQGLVDTGGITGGLDSESDARLRARLVERIQKRPQGGSEGDYIAWAKENTGVTRVWITPAGMGAGTVLIHFVTDDTGGSIIPDAGTVAAVQAYIDERRPVTAEVYVVAPTAAPLNLDIKLSPNSPAVQAAVEAELTDMLRQDAEPGGTILLSRINEAISLAAGEIDHQLVSPAADVTHTTSQIAVLGTVTFSTL